MRLSNIVAASVLLAGFGTAHAQYRCDCTSVVDTCNAEVVARGSFLEIKTGDAHVRTRRLLRRRAAVRLRRRRRRGPPELARAHDESPHPRAKLPGVPRYRSERHRNVAARARADARTCRRRASGRRRRRPATVDLRRARVSRRRTSARTSRLRRGRVHGNAGRHRRRPARGRGGAAQRVRCRRARVGCSLALCARYRARTAGRQGAHRVCARRAARKPQQQRAARAVRAINACAKTPSTTTATRSTWAWSMPVPSR